MRRKKIARVTLAGIIHEAFVAAFRVLDDELAGTERRLQNRDGAEAEADAETGGIGAWARTLP
jgi:hypothetical protein